MGWDGMGCVPCVTGACSATAVTGGELLLNYDGVKAASGLGRARRSRLMIAQDAARSAYVVMLNGALGASSGGRIGVAVSGRDLADSQSRPSNAGDAQLLHPSGAGVRDQVSACALGSTATEDCMAFDSTVGQAALRFSWESCCPEGAVIGKLPAAGACVSLAYTFTDGVDAVEVGSYSNVTGNMIWTEVPAAVVAEGFKVCGRSCADHCTQHSSCGECGGDDQCGWCPSSNQCLNRASQASCTETVDQVGECLGTCATATTCATCAQRPSCGWCPTTAACHGADASGTQLTGDACPAGEFVTSDASCGANATCPGVLNALRMPAVRGFEKVAAACSGRGACDAATGKCSCATGWAGDDCNTRCRGASVEKPCYDRGMCDKRDGSCFCKPGFLGVGCNNPAGTSTCPCGIARAVRLASGAIMQVCTGRRDGAACTCREGWVGPNCDSFCPGAGPPALAANPDAPEAKLCGGRGVCPPTLGSSSATCACDAGYAPLGVGGVCVPMTCAAGTCPTSRGRCTYNAVSRLMECTCRGGYSGQGCNSCACLNGGTCNSVSAECECLPGFTGDRCQTSIPPAALQATHCGSNGAYNAALRRCVCDDGYVGDTCGVACSASSTCNGHGACNAAGACECAEGFTGAACDACAAGYTDYPFCSPDHATSGCVSTVNGTGYRGTISRTMSGRKCQRWDVQSPIAHSLTPAAAGMAAFGIGAHNYCRNPTGDVMPWCYIDYTADTGTRARDQSTWEYCPAPLCRDESVVAAPKQCSVIGSVTIAPWIGTKTQQIPVARGNDANCATAAENAYAGNDLTLHGDVQIRTAFTTSTALPYIAAIGLEAVTAGSANAQRRKIAVNADMTFAVSGTTAGLPFAGATDAEPTITAFTTTAFSRTGVETKSATMTWQSGLVIDVMSTTCAACAGGYRLEVNVKVNAADGVANANSLCGGGSGLANVKVTCNAGTTPFGTCATVPTNAALTSACATGRAAYTAPTDPKDDEGTAVCLQCSHMTLEANCLAQLAALGVAAVGPIADVCRARFRNIYGQERSKVLDDYAPLWGTGANLAVVTAGGIPDTVLNFASYPDMSAFDRAAASAAAITESEYSLNMVKYVVGTSITRGAVGKTRGIPYSKDGTTVGRAKWPFPSIQDECRGASDVAPGGGGFVLRKLLHQVGYDQLLRVRMCNTQFPSQVAIYQTDYVVVTNAATDSNKQITLSFTPWRNDTKYEVRLQYYMGGTTSSTYAATVGTTLLGNWILNPPTRSSGFQGFETPMLTATGSAVTVTLTPALGAGAPVVGLIGVTVRAANARQVVKSYPPYAGYAQTTCAQFQTNRCGDLTFTAKANAEYFIAITGRGVAEGAYSFQLEKVLATITMLKAVSNNPAVSDVISNDGTAVRTVAGKLAKTGDTLTVTVRSGRVIDKPTIRVNGVKIRSGLVVGTGRNWEATIFIRAVFGFADGPLTVTARPPDTPSEPSRGFPATVTPQGVDKALVVFDSTPPTVETAIILNAKYLDPLNVNAPDDCKNSDDVKVTAAKHANVGDVVVMVFHASEPVVNVRAVIGGLSATVLMNSAGAAPIEVKRVRDAWRVTLEGLRTSSSPVINDETFGVAYVTLTAAVVRQGNLEFTMDYTDGAGNNGIPLTQITGSSAQVSQASSLTDRLRHTNVIFDTFVPTRSGDVALAYASEDQTTANVASNAVAFHDVQQVTAGALTYRLGDTVVADVAWNEPVTRPYGAYLRMSSNGKQHVKQSDVNIRALARTTLGGGAECRQTEFRPRAQEAVSRRANWGGKLSFALNALSSTWRFTGELEDPCDLVGPGALAWSLRNDCRAEDRGDGSFWIPMWARWCREGWGLLGYSLPEVYDAAGNKAADFAKAPVMINNARAKDVVPKRAVVGEIIVRAPVVLAGKLTPSVAVAGQKQAQNVAPSVIELYAEPSVFTWNMYRRVVKQGSHVQFHLYFDQPVKRYRIWIGSAQKTGLVRHATIAPAYRVNKPCGNGANLNEWLKGQQLVALDETIVANPGAFDSDEDFLDATINAKFASTVLGTSPDPVPCFGFWVQRGNGNYRIKRLCARRQGLLNAAGVTINAVCTDTEDRIYTSTRGHTYLQARITLTAAMMSQPDGPMTIRWQVQGVNNLWSAVTQSTNFFNRAQANSNDVATVTSRVGPGFNPKDACNRNGVSNYDQPGSSAWIAVDKTPPVLTTVAVEVNVAQADPTSLIAARGDTVTVTATYDEQLDPSKAPMFYTATGRRVNPTQVYYKTATYQLVVGVTIPATDGQLQLTFGPVSDVVGNAQTTGVTRNVFAGGKTVTIQSVRSRTTLMGMLGAGYTFSCTTSSGNALSPVVSGPNHVFSVELKSATSLSVAAATIAGADAGVTTTLGVATGAGFSGIVPNSLLTVTRTVTSAGFIDGATINWNLVLRTTTTCLSGSGTCPVKFEVNRCPAAAAVTVVGGVATVSAWTPPVVADFTPPIITSLSMVPGATPQLGPVVRPTQSARIKAVASEVLVHGANTNKPDALLKTSSDCSATQISNTMAATLTAGSTSTYEYLFALRTLVGMAGCSTSLVCITFSAATDLAGNAVTNPTMCSGFGSLLTSNQPGWLFFDNMAVTPTSFTAEKVGTSCADSSVDAASCTVAAAAVAMAPGTWIKTVIATATPTAIERVLVGGSARRGGVPSSGDHFTLDGCGNIAPTAQCEAFAARRGGCETFLCPTCAFRYSCDESCGYCQTGRGAATLQTMYVKTSDFPALSTGTLAVVANLRTTGKVSGQLTASGGGLPYAAAAANSCAGRCGGAAPSGCSCDPGCVVAGDCCADAGLCCDPETPAVEPSEPVGGCLLPPAVPLTTSVSWWSERSDGGVGTVASPGSTAYLKVTANKPIQVLSATLGGVAFEQNNIAVEYSSGAVALERSSVAAGRAAFANGDNGGFVAANTNFEASHRSLPPATLPYEYDAHTREYPSVPNTPTSTMKMGGQRLVPQPNGPLQYTIEVAERLHSPFYTKGAITTLTGAGPTWSNIPIVVEMSAAKVTSRRMAHHRRTRRHLLQVPGGGSVSVVAIGDTVSVSVSTNTPVVVESFYFETYPMSCRGSSYGGLLHGSCAIDPFIVPADPTNLADYRTTWTAQRKFDERERLVLSSNPIRISIAVVDAAGNRGGTSQDLPSPYLDNHPPVGRVAS